MKIESFRDADEAVKIANYRQQGGKSCALIITPNSITLCDVDEVATLARENDHVEYFRASDDAKKTSSR